MAVARQPSIGLWWRSERRWRGSLRLAPIHHHHLSAHTSPDAAGSGAHALADAISAECERFIREHQRAIVNYLWRMTGDEQTAYDLTQEVFLRAWQHFESVQRYDQPRAWLFRVATNLALTHLRRRSLPVGGPIPLDDEHGPAASDPAGRVAESDLVRRTLLHLSPKRRAALVLHEVYGLTASEVGLVLSMSETAVRMALHRARDQFRAIYLQEGGSGHGA